MTRDARLDMAMAAGLLGLQGQDGLAGAFALALVMHTLAPWQPPTGRELERARATARRFKISEDLAIFLPPAPGRFASRARKDAYQTLVVALKQLDALQGADRDEGVRQVLQLLGAGSAGGASSA